MCTALHRAAGAVGTSIVEVIITLAFAGASDLQQAIHSGVASVYLQITHINTCFERMVSESI